jgi:parallel beta-helix repeat protein
MNKPLKSLVVLFGVLIGVTAHSFAVAATFYVSPNGNNANPGTISQPFATLQKAHDIANPGDTIYMRGGTYALTGPINITRSGSSGNPIKVFNYPNEVPILDGASLTSSNHSAIQMNNASWWHLKGLEIKNAPAHGVYLTGANPSNNIIELCNVHHNTRVQASGGGITVRGGGNNLILNNDSHHNGKAGTSGGDGIGVNYTQSTGNVVRGNRVWRNNDDGIDLWNAANVLVENNWSWENGYNDSLQPSGGNGVGYKLGGEGTGDGTHMIRNNLSWRNRSNGFDANGANLTMNVFNNTSYSNGGSNYHFNFGSVSYVLKNNISFSPGGVSVGASTQHTFNSWNLPISVNSSDFVSLDFSGDTGPRQGDGSLPNLNFLKLVAGSDLINKGTDVGIAYTGSAPDLGAYEYINSVVSPQAPTNLVLQ